MCPKQSNVEVMMVLSCHFDKPTETSQIFNLFNLFIFHVRKDSRLLRHSQHGGCRGEAHRSGEANRWAAEQIEPQMDGSHSRRCHRVQTCANKIRQWQCGGSFQSRPVKLGDNETSCSDKFACNIFGKT